MMGEAEHLLDVHPQKKIPKSVYLIIGIMMIGAFLSMLNNTLLNVALPSIMNYFEVSTSTVQWLTTGYMLVNGILIPTSAYLLQKFSIRRLFLTAIFIFTLGTITAGFAPTFSILLVSRMIQAGGSAILMPLLMNYMLVSFPIEIRGRVMGMMGLVMFFAPAIGPTLSGWILEHYDWEMLFHLLSPIGILIFIIGFIFIQDKKEKTVVPLDKISILLSSLGFGGVLYGCSSAGSLGWGHWEVVVSLTVGIICLLIFIFRQFRLETPLLEFRVFKYPMFSLSIVINAIFSTVLFSGMILMPIYVQNLRGVSPMDSGLLMLPGAIVMGLMSPIVGRLFDKIGARILTIPGLIITVITTYLFSQLDFEASYGYLMMIYTIRMFGMSLIMMPVVTNGINQLPKRLNPHATAINSTLQQVAGAVGSAFLITVMSMSTKNEIAESMQQNANASQETIQQLTALATLHGINSAFFAATILAVVAVGLACFIKRTTPITASVEEQIMNRKI